KFASKCYIFFPCAIRTLNGVGQKVRRLEQAQQGITHTDFGSPDVFKGGKNVLPLAIKTTQPFNKRLQRPHRVTTERIGKLPSGHACGTGKLPQSLIIRLNRLAHVDEHAAESRTAHFSANTDRAQGSRKPQYVRGCQPNSLASASKPLSHVKDVSLGSGEVVPKLGYSRTNAVNIAQVLLHDVHELGECLGTFLTDDVGGHLEHVNGARKLGQIVRATNA